MTSKSVAFVDLYWLGCEMVRLSEAITAVEHALRLLPSSPSLSRVYLYAELDPRPSSNSANPVNPADSAGHAAVASSSNSLSTLGAVPLVVRVCAQDALDDGYELVRAMDTDMRQAAQSDQIDTFVVASMDDRLALTIEQIKYKGKRVVGLQVGKGARNASGAAADDADDSLRRMSRVFDQILEPRLDQNVQRTPWSSASGHQGQSPISPISPTDKVFAEGSTSDPIGRAVDHWIGESDEMTRDSAIEFMGVRRGLPKLVDARLLFLCRQELGRELTEPEKFELRRRFRNAVQERTTV